MKCASPLPDEAAQAGALGWSIIPVGLNKRPLLKSWKPYQEHRPTPDELQAWAAPNPPAWAVICGAVSELVVLDFDGKAGKATAERIGIRPHVLTGSGGLHAYFTHPGHYVQTLNSKAKAELGRRYPGLDIRADGGYAIFTGKNQAGAYKWLRPMEPDSIETLPADLRAFLGLDPPAEQRAAPPPPTPRQATAGEFIERKLQTALSRASNEGRNNAGLWLACQLRDEGLPESEAEGIMRRYAAGVPSTNQHGHHEPYLEVEARASMRQAYSAPRREPARNPNRTSAETRATRFNGPARNPARTACRNAPRTVSIQSLEPTSVITRPLTDMGNAERFAARCGADFRYAAGRWWTYTGTKWEEDRTGRAMQAAKSVTRALYAEAAQIEDGDVRKATAAWARKSESAEKLRAMLMLAQSEGEIPIQPDSWNRDAWLLNCENGTVDLRDGSLGLHRREHLITTICAAKYDPAARHELWGKFLEDSTAGDSEFQNFLQRSAGYSASGDTREEKLFLILGPTGSGKSTFIEAIKAALGDHAKVADFETFVQKRESGIRNDIAGLVGKRLVASVEVEEGKRLAEGLVKSLTGRDTISARFLHQEFFEFRPQFKLWLVANDPPKVRHNDDAIWRRILRVPFEHTILEGKRDPTLKDRLCQLPECRSAVLAWLVEGCLRWLEDGLQAPQRVTSATKAYREEQNPLRAFVEDRCRLDAEAMTLSAELRGAYERWSEQEGFTTQLNPNRFSDALKGLRCTPDRGAAGRRFWRGIALLESRSDAR
jgi:putative DNA primase/helicase